MRSEERDDTDPGAPPPVRAGAAAGARTRRNRLPTRPTDRPPRSFSSFSCSPQRANASPIRTIRSTSNPKRQRSLYRDLVLVRRVDNEGTALQRQGELGLWASLLGQEAAQVGSGRALRPGDFAFPTYREHGVAWTRGIPPINMLAMFRGVNNGGWDPHETKFMLYTIVIGSQTLHARGLRDGRAARRRGRGGHRLLRRRRLVAGRRERGLRFPPPRTTRRSSSSARNNQWAISEPTERQSRVPLYHPRQRLRFPGVRVDGNDVFACLAVTRAALDQRCAPATAPC